MTSSSIDKIVYLDSFQKENANKCNDLDNKLKEISK